MAKVKVTKRDVAVTPSGPQADLGPAGRDLWVRLTSAYRIDDEHGKAVLAIACKALDRAESCRKVIDKDGLSTRDRWGQVKVHPLLAPERDARAAVLLALRQLSLPIPVESKEA